MKPENKNETRTSTGGGGQEAIVLPAGARIQQFEILSLLGRGGMGQVYVARDHRLDRKVAIKFLPSFLNDDQEPVRRFEREARAASALNHPNIVTIYDSGESEWGPYIVMELIQGRPLRELIAGGIPLPRVLELALQTVEAARVAHEAGIVHRDLKPDNILVRDDGYVKVVDFGLARLSNVDAALNLTASGVFMGTLKYVSPEQGRGSQVDDRSDVFSLGLIFYLMATGRHPFEAGSSLATLLALTTEPATAPSSWNPGIPVEFDALILRMLEKAPGDRPSTAEVAESLRAMITGTSAMPLVAPIVQQAATATVIVGRDLERDVLMRAFETAEGGRGTLVCISGEAGMGKSALVDSFIAKLGADRRRCLVGSGRSSQRLAGAEAYAPLLEALNQQLRSDRTGRFGREMKQLAPSWHALIVSATESAATELLPRAHSQDRMKQELYALFQRVGREYPLVVLFEDFHWADLSTADAVVYLASRFEDLRLLLIISYRESELLQTGHAIVSAKLDMQARGLVREIRLDVLSRAHVELYLSLAFPRNRFPQELPEKIYKRTGGHPLFVADLVRYLKESGGIREDEDVWVLDSSFEQLEKGLPESVRSMVERKLSGVSDAHRRLLGAAAVQGDDFDSAVLSRVLEMDAAEVEEQLEVLDRVFALVSLVEETEMPDRTLNCRYRFAHMLYQEYCLGLLRPSRKAALYGATARALEALHQAQAPEIAAKLALLFEGARDFRQAADYFLLAAGNATAVFAHRESAVMARRGLDAVRSLPRSPERDAQELRLQLALGGSLCMTVGYAGEATVSCFSRALALAQELGDAAQGQQIWGLWMASTLAGDCNKSSDLSARLLRMSEEAGDPTFLAAAHYAAALALELAGDLQATKKHVEKVLRLDSPDSNRNRVARWVVDPLISAGGIHLRVLALLGFSGAASDRWNAQRARVDQDALDPRSVCDVLIVGCVYHALLRRPGEVRGLATRAIEICDRFDIFFERQWAAFWDGWALTESVSTGTGLEAMRGFLALITSAGCLMHHSLYIATFAEALVKAGAREEAREWIRQGLALIERTGQHYFESELHRVLGELEGVPGGAHDEARLSLHRAVGIAANQDARLLEMRAALSLGRFLRQEGATEDARRVLSNASDRMRTGFDSPELFEAKTILRELS